MSGLGLKIAGGIDFILPFYDRVKNIGANKFNQIFN